MGCYTFYIFNRNGTCQYYHEWTRQRRGVGVGPEDFKLTFGLFWSMRGLAAALDPTRSGGKAGGAVGRPLRIGEGAAFRSFQTDAYKMHFYESPTGLKLVMLTDPSVGDLSNQLATIYGQLFVQHVARNPLYSPGDAFLFEPFSSALNKYIRSLGLAEW